MFERKAGIKIGKFEILRHIKIRDNNPTVFNPSINEKPILDIIISLTFLSYLNYFVK